MRWPALALTLSLCGCGHEAARPSSVAEPASRGLTIRPVTPYASVVERIAALERGEGAACLFEERGVDYVFVGEPATAITPMPPVDDAGLRIALAAPRLRLVSRWGIDGDSGPFVATLTHHAPAGPEGALVVFVGLSQASLRATGATPPPVDRLSPGGLLDALRRAPTAPLVVFVAEAGLPFSSLRPYLEAADAGSANVALGVALSPGVDVPPPRAEPERSRAGLCDALEPLEAGASVGAVGRDAARAAMQPLREAATRCAESSASRRVAAGGRMRLAVRIGPGGTATLACMLEDAIDDAGFRRCLLDAAMQNAWPAPSPSGYVDVVAPLLLAPDTRGVHRSLCVPEPTPTR